MILGEILSERFAICPAFGFDEFTHIHKGVITFADDVLHSAFGKQFLQDDAAGIGRLDDGLRSFGISHFVGAMATARE